MRSILIALFLLLFTFPAQAEQPQDIIDLSKTHWGMSRAEVGKALNLTLPEGRKHILLKAELDKHEAGVMYLFDNDKLVGVNAQVTKNLSPEGAKQLVADLTQELTKRYGVPAVADRPLRIKNKGGGSYSKWHKDATTHVVLQRDQAENQERVTVAYACTKTAESMQSKAKKRQNKEQKETQ